MPEPVFRSGPAPAPRPAAVACLAGLALGLLAGCTVPGSRQTFEETARLVAGQTAAPLQWRRDAAADEALDRAILPLLEDGIGPDEAVLLAFLASPDLQWWLEQLELGRADLVAAYTLPNPVAIVGQRSVGGRLAPFFPERSLSLGLLQNVSALLKGPGQRRMAREELARQGLQTADRLVGLAAEVHEAWLEHAAALQILAVRERSLTVARRVHDSLVVMAANGSGATALDVALERQSVLQAEAQVLRAKLDVDSLRARLGQRLGLAGRHDGWHSAGPLPALPATDPDALGLEEEALRQRLDLREARQAVVARLETLRQQRRFRWLGGIELGAFRDGSSGGIHYAGPNLVIELPLLDQRQAALLAGDAGWRAARRQLESRALAARTEIRTHQAEMATTRQLLVRYRGELQGAPLQTLVGEAAVADPAGLGALRLAQGRLLLEAEAIGHLRDYWRARAALARAAGDWDGLLH
ncbi:MAG: hypothetical protein RL026_727 [Pseudomonadota bacterium]